MASEKSTPARQIAYVYAPYFGARVAQDADPALNTRPLALLDDAGRVVAVDARAATTGVAPGQTERQAVARCPPVLLRPAATYPIHEAQAALIKRASGYAGRWQPAGLGALYLDATGLPGSLLGWCQELAHAVRDLGWTPTLGLANGKFGASTAAQTVAPAPALILDPVTLQRFLAPQPVALLPLGADALQQLRHLGIRTLGQYARLPTTAVLTRWGQAGKTMQQWAQGNDHRPVILPAEQPRITARIEFDGVLLDRAILLAALIRKAEALLIPLQNRCQAIGCLALVITRGDGRVVPVTHTFPLPTATVNSIKLALSATLERMTWEGEGATDVSLTLGDITDAPAPQLSLFDTPTRREILVATLAQLAARYGSEAFCMATLSEPDHPLPERRVSWQTFG